MTDEEALAEFSHTGKLDPVTTERLFERDLITVDDCTTLDCEAERFLVPISITAKGQELLKKEKNRRAGPTA
jgi:hypothetical protein